MRSHPTVLVAIAAFGATLLFGCTGGKKSDSSSRIVAGKAEIGVEQLAKDPTGFSGRAIALRGVVATATPDRHLFTVIDQSEYDSCKELSCSSYEVPVAFAGALPETARSVRIVGRLTQPEPGRYVVNASQIEVIR